MDLRGEQRDAVVVATVERPVQRGVPVGIARVTGRPGGEQEGDGVVVAVHRREVQRGEVPVGRRAVDRGAGGEQDTKRLGPAFTGAVDQRLRRVADRLAAVEAPSDSGAAPPRTARASRGGRCRHPGR